MNFPIETTLKPDAGQIMQKIVDSIKLYKALKRKYKNKHKSPKL